MAVNARDGGDVRPETRRVPSIDALIVRFVFVLFPEGDRPCPGHASTRSTVDSSARDKDYMIWKVCEYIANYVTDAPLYSWSLSYFFLLIPLGLSASRPMGCRKASKLQLGVRKKDWPLGSAPGWCASARLTRGSSSRWNLFFSSVWTPR